MIWFNYYFPVSCANVCHTYVFSIDKGGSWGLELYCASLESLRGLSSYLDTQLSIHHSSASDECLIIYLLCMMQTGL